MLVIAFMKQNSNQVSQMGTVGTLQSSHHKEEEKGTLCGVYTLQGVDNKNAVKIVFLDTVRLDEGQQIKDTFINFYQISKYISGHIWVCNITNHYLISSKKQPMMYVDIWLSKRMKKKLVFRMYLNFIIQEDIESKESFLTKPLKGKFQIEISMGSITKELDNNIKVYPGNKGIIDRLKELTLTEEMKALLLTMESQIDEEWAAEYKDEFEYLATIPKNRITLKDMYMMKQAKEKKENDEKGEAPGSNPQPPSVNR